MQRWILSGVSLGERPGIWAGMGASLERRNARPEPMPELDLRVDVTDIR